MPDGFLGLSARQVISLSCDHFNETKLSVWVVHLACEMACNNILAHGFGADGVVVDTSAELANAIQLALKSGRTTLVVARIDGSGYMDQFRALREV